MPQVRRRCADWLRFRSIFDEGGITRLAAARLATAKHFSAIRCLASLGEMSSPQPQALAFKHPEDLARWFVEDHETSSELWVSIYKAGSQQPSVTWTDCVVEAIRFGWIDGLKRPGGASYYL